MIRQLPLAVAMIAPEASRTSPSANATRRPGLVTWAWAVNMPLAGVTAHLDLDRGVPHPGRQLGVHRAPEGGVQQRADQTAVDSPIGL